MNLNYNIHHKLATHEVLSDLNGKPHMITWIAWCQIIHVCWFTKSKTCAFRQGDFSRDLKTSQRITRDSLKFLVDKGMIKCQFPYQKSTKTPGIYVMTNECMKIARTLYPKNKRKEETTANRNISESNNIKEPLIQQNIKTEKNSWE